MEPETSDPKKQKPYKDYLRYSGLGFQILFTIGTAAWVGYRIDRFIGWKFPVFLLLFVLGAFTGIIYKLYRSIDKN